MRIKIILRKNKKNRFKLKMKNYYKLKCKKYKKMLMKKQLIMG